MSDVEVTDALRDRSTELPSRVTWATFPWWLAIIIAFLVAMFVLIITTSDYRRAFEFMRTGLGITVYATILGFGLAMVIGVLAGLGRVSSNVVIRNVATSYVEFIRGIPVLVLLFVFALVLVPATIEFVAGLGVAITVRDVSFTDRGVIALAIIYGAYIAEIIRAGIQSVPSGQMEAARATGMTNRQAMRHIVMPQAIRNVLPALGNDFIAMLKDTALLSVLAIREITHLAKLHAGVTFDTRESYLVLTFMFLTMTITLSLLLQVLERRLRRGTR